MFIDGYAYSVESTKSTSSLPGFLVGTEAMLRKFKLTDTLSQGKVGLIIAAGNVTWFNTSTTDETFRSVPLLTSEIIGARWANMLGANDWVSVDGSACASMAVALKQAKWLLSTELDTMYIVNVDNAEGVSLNQLFDELGVFTSTPEFFLKYACSVVKLTKECHNTSVAEISDINVSRYVSKNVLGVTKEGYMQVISPVKKRYFDYIKPHGTNTQENEIAEQEAINSFGFTDVPQLRYKADIGHALGSATGLELCLTLGTQSGTGLHLSAGMGNMYGSFVTTHIHIG